jgi:hypothetical protein
MARRSDAVRARRLVPTQSFRLGAALAMLAIGVLRRRDLLGA